MGDRSPKSKQRDQKQKDATKTLASLAASPNSNVRCLDGSGASGGPFR